MRDVARRAGVSQPLVSLVIAGSPTVRVAEATRQRILDVARELGYRPNVVARALVRGRSFAVGVLIGDLRNPVSAEIVTGAERVAAERGYAVLFCDAGEDSVERHVEALRARQIDGIIIDAMAAASLPEAGLSDLNVVLVDQPANAHHGIASDAAAAGRLAGEHLLGWGHRHVGFIGPASDVWAFRMRERGFVQTLRDAGLGLASDDLRRAPPTVDGGKEAMSRLLGAPSHPSAVFCANDLMAIGALKACAAARVSVPAEVSVMGCDDIDAARLLTPELTSIAVPMRELGARAARLLLQLLDGVPVRAPRLLPVRLVARGTTGPAPGSRT